jgi:hypothetical protein
MLYILCMVVFFIMYYCTLNWYLYTIVSTKVTRNKDIFEMHIDFFFFFCFLLRTYGIFALFFVLFHSSIYNDYQRRIIYLKYYFLREILKKLYFILIRIGIIAFVIFYRLLGNIMIYIKIYN